MPQSFATILTIVLPLLQWAATTGGSGELTAWFVNQVRAALPTEPTNPLGRAVYALFYAPLYARITALVAAAMFSVAAQGAIAFLTQQPVSAAIDVALAAAIAAIWSQLAHGRTLAKLSPAAAERQQRAATAAQAAAAARLAAIRSELQSALSVVVSRALAERGTLTPEQQAEFLADVDRQAKLAAYAAYDQVGASGGSADAATAAAEAAYQAAQPSGVGQ